MDAVVEGFCSERKEGQCHRRFRLLEQWRALGCISAVVSPNQTHAESWACQGCTQFCQENAASAKCREGMVCLPAYSQLQWAREVDCRAPKFKARHSTELAMQ